MLYILITTWLCVTYVGKENSLPKTVVITCDELSAMAIYQETGIPSVCVPNNGSTIAPEVLPLLEELDTIVIWVDQSEEVTSLFA